MGARPRWSLLSIGVPNDVWHSGFIDNFYKGVFQIADRFSVKLIGGDLSRAEKLTIVVTANGWLEARPLLRSGARVGDRVYVSRPIGGSAAGLELLTRWQSTEPPRDLPYAQREFALSAIRVHTDPDPEVKLGIALAGLGEVTSCIDISDGLSTDLHHLCAASGVGAELERQRVPLFPDLLGAGGALGIDVRSAVLHGGEEYALLFTSALREADLSSRLGRPVYAIGRIVEKGIRVDGEPLEARGFDHFALR
jgi:thiamine-monophosphate kinase